MHIFLKSLSHKLITENTTCSARAKGYKSFPLGVVARNIYAFN